MHTIEFGFPVKNPVLVFALVMLIILIAPLLFKRVKMPGIVGLIVAGVFVGPHALGVLERDETMILLGTVGLLYLMFQAGLEVDLNQFIKYRRRSLLFGAVTFIIPQVVGAVIARTLLGFGWPTSILFGSVIASHTLLAYPIVSRMGLAKNKAVTTAVGATILTDVLALLVLAVIAVSAEGELTPAFGVRFALMFAAFVALVFGVLPRLGRWFFRRLEHGDGAAGFVFVLAAVFTTAFLAEVAGVEPIIGAFLAGLALNRLVPEQGTLMNRIQFVGESLFVPFFLVSVGMLVDLSVFVGGVQAWLVAGYMVIAVFVSKGISAFLTRGMFRYGREEAWLIFGLTLAQAAATLAAVMIGYRLGLFDTNVLNGTILMILVTCFVAPWVAQKYGREVAVLEEEKPYEPSEAPQRILVPLVDTETVVPLVELALMVRDRRSDQPVYPLVVAGEGSGAAAEVARFEKILEEAEKHAAAAEVPVVPLTRIDYNVASGILRAVTEQRITTVLLGWNGENTARHYVFGRVIDALLESSDSMVWVTRTPHPLNTHKRVVVVVSPYAWREVGFPLLLRAVKLLANQLGAGLHIVAGGAHADSIESMAASTRPDVNTGFTRIENWSLMVNELQNILEPTDLLIVVSAREGTVSWRPGLKKLPRVLTKRFPDISQIIAFPSEVAYTLKTAPSKPALLPSVEPRDVDMTIVLDVSGETWETVLENLTEGAKWNPAMAARMQRLWLEVEADYSFEMLPGAALLHASVP